MEIREAITIEIPTHCPACETLLDVINEVLFCRNDSCPARGRKKLEGFASHLKIRGLGPATLDKLHIEDLHDLYSLEKHEIIMRLSSDKVGSKVYDEIQKSKSVDLQTLLPAFSINLIGRSASNKLCKVVSNISDINAQTCNEAGLGPKATESLLNWLSLEFYPNDYISLPFDFVSSETIEKEEIKGTVCITGKLNSFPTKAHAQKVLENYGYIVKSSLTQDCTHLINESGIESAKTKTARSRGVIVINNLKEFLKK
jgi:DNA ligase (NAD+)